MEKMVRYQIKSETVFRSHFRKIIQFNKSCRTEQESVLKFKLLRQRLIAEFHFQ